MSAIKNYVHKTSFRLDIPTKDGKVKTFPLVVQETMIPGMTVANATVAVNKMLKGNIIGSGVTFDPLHVRMILDEDMEGYTDIFQWMTSTTDYFNNESSEPEELPKHILIHVIDNAKKKIVCTFKYVEPFPTTVGTIDFSYAEDGNMAMVVDVQFVYKWFEIDRNGVIIQTYKKTPNVPPSLQNRGLHPAMR